jgi:DNA-binding CsgD family transcriptional regulator
MAEPGEPLSERELEVLQCLASGASNKEIAAELLISQNTVKVHLRNIYTKLGAASRTEAATAAIQQGMIVVPGMVAAPNAAETAVSDASAAVEAAAVDGENRAGADAAGAAPRPAAPAWRTPAILIVALIAVVAAIALGFQLLQPTTPTPTPEPFAETPIADTRWLISRPMPDERAHMAVAVVGLDLYAIGGETAAGVVGDVAVFNNQQRVWRTAAGKPTAVTDATAVDLFGEIYVPGGRLADGAPTAVVEAYSPSQDAWRPIADLPQPVAGGLTLTDGAFLYLLGGWNGQDYLDTAYVYDPSANAWRPLPPMRQPRAFAAGDALTGQLYVVGGANDGEELATCEKLDPVLETWEDCPDMLQARAGAGATVMVNKLYVIGGGLGANAITYSEVYDPKDRRWQVLNTPTLDAVSNLIFPGVAHIETRIYVLGGQRGEALLADNVVYSPLIYQTFIPAASSSGRGE